MSIKAGRVCTWVVMPFPLPTGILASVCGGLVMLLPETKGIALPETVEDVEKLGRYCARFNAPYMLRHGALIIHGRNDVESSVCTLKQSKD